MSVVDNICPNDKSYYIPHHCILKSDGSSTPCSIVFDVSMKTDT